MPGVAVRPIGSGSPPTAVSHASPPWASFTSLGALSRWRSGSQLSQMSGGSRMWQSAISGGAVVATGSRLLVGDAEPTELVERHAGRGGETDRVRVAADGGEPRVAPLGVLHELGCLVAVALRQPVVPDVGRLEDVAVRDLGRRRCGNRLAPPRR